LPWIVHTQGVECTPWLGVRTRISTCTVVVAMNARRARSL
jgi:hypothetical protein